MIWESWYWKKPLLDMAERLRVLKTGGDLSDEQLAQVERDIFIGFYSVRKLLETITKVTDATKTMKVPLKLHANRENVNLHNKHKLDELYDLEIATSETRDIRFVCGRIIHSFIFTPCLNEYGLAGIMFTSDIDRQSKLYSLDIDEVVRIYERVGEDEPTEIHWGIDPETHEEKAVVK